MPGCVFADDYNTSLNASVTFSGVNPSGAAGSFTVKGPFALTDVYFLPHIGSGFGYLSWNWADSKGVIVNSIDSAAIPVSISHSGLNLSDLSFSYPLQFIAGNVDSSNVVYPVFTFTGSAVVKFSDGSSQSIPLYCSSGQSSVISFSAKKDNRSNQFLLSSEDFNLSSDDASVSSDNVGLTSAAASLVTKNASYVSRNASYNSNSVQISSDKASISGSDVSIRSSDAAFRSDANSGANIGLGDLTISSSSASISSNSNNNNSLSANGGSSKTIGSIVSPNNAVNSSTYAINSALRSFSLNSYSISLSSASVSFVSKAVLNYLTSFSFYGGDLSFSDGRLSFSDGSLSASEGSVAFSEGNFFGQDGELTANAGQFGLADGSLSAAASDFSIAEKGVINEAPVTLSEASPFITVTGFSVTGTINITKQNIVFPNVGSSSNNAASTTFFFACKTLYTFGSSESMLSRIAGTLDNIYYSLRYELPLTLRHLIIPTQEEVIGVIEDSLEETAEKYPAAAGTITTVQNQLTDFSAAISGSTKKGLVLPGVTIPVGNKQIKLWEDFDVMPYLDSQPVRQLMFWIELMLKAVMFIFLIQQGVSMVIDAICGYSYLEWFGMGNKPFMGDDSDFGEPLPEGYFKRKGLE